MSTGGALDIAVVWTTCLRRIVFCESTQEVVVSPMDAGAELDLDTMAGVVIVTFDLDLDTMAGVVVLTVTFDFNGVVAAASGDTSTVISTTVGVDLFGVVLVAAGVHAVTAVPFFCRCLACRRSRRSRSISMRCVYCFCLSWYRFSRRSIKSSRELVDEIEFFEEVVECIELDGIGASVSVSPCTWGV